MKHIKRTNTHNRASRHGRNSLWWSGFWTRSGSGSFSWSRSGSKMGNIFYSTWDDDYENEENEEYEEDD